MRLALALLISMAIVLSGCGGQQHSPAPKRTPVPSAAPTPKAVPAHGSGIRGVVTLDGCTDPICTLPATIRIYRARAAVTVHGRMSAELSTDAAGDFVAPLPPGKYILFVRDSQQRDISGAFAVQVLAHHYRGFTLKLYVPSM